MSKARSRWWLVGNGTLAVIYCLAVLTYVSTSPDIRVRSLLLDLDRPEGLPSHVRGVIMRSVPPTWAMAQNMSQPSAGDVLVTVSGEPVESFFDLNRQVVRLRNARLQEKARLHPRADISELRETDLPPLVQDAELRRWVEVGFWTRRSEVAQSVSSSTQWSQETTYLLVQNLPLADVSLSLVWFFLQLGIFSVGALAIWRRPFDQSARLFFAMCIVTLVAFVGGFHWWVVAGNPWLNTPFVLCAVLLPVVSLHFFCSYPQPRRPLSTHPRATLLVGYAIPLLSATGLVLLLEYSRWLSGPASGGTLEPLHESLGWLRLAIDAYLLIAASCFIAILVVLAHGYLTTRHPIHRSQMKWLFWAGLLATVPIGYALVLALLEDPEDRVRFALGWPARLSMFLASLAFMLAYAIGMIRFRLMLIDQLLSRGVFFYFARVGLALGFGVAIAVAWLIIDALEISLSPHPGTQQVLSLGSILVVISVILLWLRDRLQHEIDRRFYREKYQLNKALGRINDAVVQVGDRQSLAKRMLSSCHDVFEVDSAALYLSEAHGSDFQLGAVQGETSSTLPLRLSLDELTLTSLQQQGPLPRRVRGENTRADATDELMDRLQSELLYPLEFDEQLVALVVLGNKQDGTTYSAEDLTFLAALGQITCVALHGASVHQDMSRLNDELQMKAETISEQERQIAMLQADLLDQPEHESTSSVGDGETFQRDPIIGSSPALHRVLDTVRKVASSESSVLIQGPSGTGKELLVQVLHENSPRADGPLVRVHCAALSSSLLESELFGHVRGAFTGADRDRIGRFEMANGGTLFLDEIGDISLETQIKLLRVLQSRSFEPVGSARTIDVDVRLVTATHQNLQALITQGRFREDLYYRLNVISVSLPPLSERLEDIVDLAVHFVHRCGRRLGKHITNLDEDAVLALKAYHWPGNIRELENAIERAVVLTDGDRITVADLPLEIRQVVADGDEMSGAGVEGHEERAGVGNRPDRPVSGTTGTEALVAALSQAGGNKAQAARLLGMPRSTFFSKLKKHGLD